MKNRTKNQYQTQLDLNLKGSSSATQTSLTSYRFFYQIGTLRGPKLSIFEKVVNAIGLVLALTIGAQKIDIAFSFLMKNGPIC